MSGTGYPGQGMPPNSNNQQWGGQQNPSHQGQWQNGQSSGPGWSGQPQGGAPQGYAGGPQGYAGPPQGYPGGPQPGGESRGPKVAIISIIAVLVLAIIGVLVWIFFFKGDDGGSAEPETSKSSSAETPSDSEEPGGEDTPGGDEPGGEDTPGGDKPGGEEPGGEQPGGQQPGGEQPGGQQPGGEQPGGEQPGGQQPGGQQPGGQQPGSKPGGAGELTADDLPKKVDDWQLNEFGLMMYSKGVSSTATIVVIDFGENLESTKYIRQGMKDVEEFDGGFCGSMDAGGEKVESCYINPGKKPKSVVSVSGAGADRADVVKVAKAIVAYK